jgi:hypothetical protein
MFGRLFAIVFVRGDFSRRGTRATNRIARNGELGKKVADAIRTCTRRS